MCTEGERKDLMGASGAGERLRQMSVSCIFSAVALVCVSRPDSLPQEVTNHAF